MNRRQRNGATLAVIAGAAVFLIIVGLALYFMAQLMGGGRELRHATNSGALNVAKQALLTPHVRIPDGDDDIKDMKEILLGYIPRGEDKVDLLHFNQMVGAALLVAMNAEADGNPKALANARKFIDLVEGRGTSIGNSLKQSMEDGDSWARDCFLNTAGGNSLRMLTASENIRWQNRDWKVAYLGQGTPTNLSVNFLKQDNSSNLPFTNVTSFNVPTDSGGTLMPDGLTSADLPSNPAEPLAKRDEAGDIVLLGYSPFNFPNVRRSIYAVPLDRNPHLVKLSDFAEPGNTTRPPGFGTVLLPPNSYQTGAMARDEKTSKRDVHILSAAMSGTSRRAEDVSLPYGYIVIDNSSTLHYHGIAPNTNNVFARELGPGIDVDPTSRYFDNAEAQDPPRQGQIRTWHKTPREGPNGVRTTGNYPEWDLIFDRFGNPATSAQQVDRSVPYYPDPQDSPAIKCLHSNSDSNSPGKISQCVELADRSSGDNRAGLSPFDWAYHRNEDQTYGSSGTIDSDNLTAAEQTACRTIETWEKATKEQIRPPFTTDFNFASTGLRLYPEGHNPIQGRSAPWAKPNRGFNQHIPPDAAGYSSDETCKITTAGTVVQLIDQTMGYPVSRDTYPQAMSPQSLAVERIIKQRMHEILPASDAAINAEYRETVGKTPIELGHKMYVYLDPAQGFKHFKVGFEGPTQSGGAPPWLSKGKLAIRERNGSLAAAEISGDGARLSNMDGTTTRVAARHYGIAQTIADPNFQWGIHNTPFLTQDGVPVITDPGVDAANPAITTNGNGKIIAYDSVYVTPNSGVYGNLLNIKFVQRTSGESGFSDRD